MAVKKRSTKKAWRDPDDAPPLGKGWFASADLMVGDRVVRRGRPPGTAAKQAISIRVDKDVLAHFRAAGPGWQARINDVLRRSAVAQKRRGP
jgi:uncharacterized protein (DUF4415 family)